MKNNNYTVLSVENLSKHFKIGTGSEAFTLKAVDEVSFEIKKGEVYGLVGESGSGKTTTGRTIIRLYEATNGTVEFTTEENGQLVTKIIGAGYLETYANIRRIKRDYNFKSLDYRPYLSIRTTKKNEYSDLRQRLINEIDKASLERDEKYLELNSDIVKFKEKIFNINQNNIYKIEELQFERETNLLKLKHQNENILLELKNRYKALKHNTNQKISGVKDSSALSRDERLAIISDYKATYEKERLEIQTEIQEYVKIPKSERQAIKKDIKAKSKKIKFESKNEIKLVKQEHYNSLVKAYQNYNNRYKTTNASNLFKLKIINKLILFKHKIKNYKLLKEYRKKIRKLKIKKVTNVIEKRLNFIGLFFKHIFNFKNFKENKKNLKLLKKERNLKIIEQKNIIKELKKQNNPKMIGDTIHKVQMIFQDPIESLNPRMTVKEIISEGLIIQGEKNKKVIDEKVKNILGLVGLSEDYLYRYPHEFSGGQRQRIGIARALIVEPELIIADEPVSALDVSIQAQVINLLSELKEKLGLTILFVAHDLSVVKYFCDKIAVMNQGRIVEKASIDELFDNPIHPYTISLISAIPQPDPIFEKTRKRIVYEVSDHDYSIDKPSLREVRKDHYVYLNKSEFENYQKNGKVI